MVTDFKMHRRHVDIISFKKFLQTIVESFSFSILTVKTRKITEGRLFTINRQSEVGVEDLWCMSNGDVKLVD